MAMCRTKLSGESFGAVAVGVLERWLFVQKMKYVYLHDVYNSES
jgi:hypothetical protein